MVEDIMLKCEALACTICCATFKSETILRKHIRRANCSRPFKCEDCPTRFRTGEKLVKHAKYCQKLAVCSSCGKSFANQARLRSHEVCHKVKSEHCEKCRKTFSRPNDLKLHMRSHSSEKLYGCSHCKSQFKHLGGLKSHMISHSQEMPYICDVCEIGFKRGQTLKKHRKIHTDRVRNFMCKMCDKKFIDLGNLQQHRKLHDSETPLPCPKCEKFFAQPNYLKNHFETAHATVKPFKCQSCEKRFAMFRMLNKHMKSHLGERMKKKEKTFKCKSCIKSFSLRINLIKHRFIHK